MAPRTVLITGCSRGSIGDALAREFDSREFQVFATARKTAKMTELAEMGITTLELDVTSPASIAAAVDAVQTAARGRLSMLINSAGIAHVMPFADSKLDDIKRVFDINVFGVMAVTQAFLPLLLAAHGLVVNVGSVCPVLCPPFHSAYNASKAALHTFGHTLQLELASLGVRVVTIATGAVATHLFDNLADTCQLPEDSLYAPLKDQIEEKRGYLGIENGMPAHEYAHKVASDLVKGKPKLVIWRAPLSKFAWYLKKFARDGFMDNAIIKSNGLDTLQPFSKAQQDTHRSAPGSSVHEADVHESTTLNDGSVV